MNLIFGYFQYFFTWFPVFFALVLVLMVWSIYDQNRFMRFEGDVKRGVMIWVEPISWEIRQFLETLATPIRSEQSFIRKDGREVLIIAREKPLWGIFSRRRNQWPYIGYVNLSSADSGIELRVSWSSLIGLVISSVILLIVLFFWTFSGMFWNGRFYPSSLFNFFPLIFVVIYIISMRSNHNRERKRMLEFLKWAMEQPN
jgi:hypothetical protein